MDLQEIMQFLTNKYAKYSFLFIAVTSLLRLFFASSIELGNDEVYYIEYARFPDYSHFDHPPMIGYLIQVFTGGLTFASEGFIRLGSVVGGVFSSFFLYLIGKEIKDERTGFIAVVLFNASIYAFVIAGVFIMPDAVMLPLWLGSVWLYLKYLKTKKTSFVLWFGLLAGLAIYSKYHAVFLWLGVLLHVLFFERELLKKWQLYLSGIISLSFVGIIFLWNYQHQFISFTFHEKRVGNVDAGINWNTFFQEIAGEVLYQNPILFFLIVLSLIIGIKKHYINKSFKYYFLFTSFPLIITVLYLALSKKTLPHWVGPAYCTLIPITACYISELKRFRIVLASTFGLTVIGLFLSFGVIKKGWFLPEVKEGTETYQWNKNDFTLDLYGWQQFNQKFLEFSKENKVEGIVSDKWFPGSHIKYYVAEPNDLPVYFVGNTRDLHEYVWTSPKLNSELTNQYYITHSRLFRSPENVLNNSYFNKAELVKEIPIIRSDKIIEYFFIYKLNR